MKRNSVSKILLVLSMISAPFILTHSVSFAQRTEPLIIDHTCTDIAEVPDEWINQAIAKFRLSYGHTSHGSQIVIGMILLRGTSGSLYWFDHYGTEGGLSLHGRKPSGDLGMPNRTEWYHKTRTLLDDPDNDRNMIMWSWCGQVSNATHDDIANSYLTLMNQLETDYPDVTFVYMTGHLDGTGEEGNLNVRNNQIRQYCMDNNKILYDFADIESYDPDGNCFLDKGATDSCTYDDGEGRNWANEWCAANPGKCAACSCAHSPCLNCQLKGRAFWYMMARLAGWNECLPSPTGLTATADSVNRRISLSWTDISADLDEDSFIIQRQVDGGEFDNIYDTVAANATLYTDSGLTAGAYHYRVVAHLNDDGTGNPCDSAPSNVATAVIVSAVPPDIPSDLDAMVDPQDRSISLTWTDNSNNEAGFIVQRQTNDGAWDDIYAPVGADTTIFRDQGLSQGKYKYRIVVYNDYGSSSACNEAEAAILDIKAPTSLQATGGSMAEPVSVSWTGN